MNNYTSELSELNKQNQELKNTLYDVEVRIGHNLIKNSNTTIEADLKSKYLSIQSDLESAKKDLETLNELQNSVNETETEIYEASDYVPQSEVGVKNNFANKGQIKRVANSTFIITPSNVDVSGDLVLEELESGTLYL